MSDPQERVYFLPVEHGRYVSDCCYIRERCIDYICPRVIPTLWHSGHCNNSTKGNPQVVCAFCKKLGYFSHLILALLTYWFFFAFELRLLTEWEALGNGLLCQDPSLKFCHLTVADCMYQLSYTAFGHETDQS